MRTLLITLLLLVSGCVTFEESLPENYTGSTASIDDSFRRVGGGKAFFYYVESIDGRLINNAKTKTNMASSGTGRLHANGFTRLVATNEQSIALVAEVMHFAPIGQMFNSGHNYFVEGIIKFTPQADHKYLVNGTLGEQYSAIWLEDIEGNIVSEVIEKIGDEPTSKRKPDNQIKNKVSKQEFYLGLSGGETETFVISKLGEPTSKKTYKPSFFNNEKRPSITYYYDDLGGVEFLLFKEKPTYLERLIPEIKASDSLETVKLQLETDGRTLQYIAKKYSRMNIMDIDKLDLFANKIWQEKDNKDSYLIDALSWFCRILGESDTSRYKTFLETVSKQSDRLKLRKYAKYGFELQKDIQKNAEQFYPNE